MTTDPTNQQTDQPPSQPTAQPTPPPASPNADQQYASSVEGAARAWSGAPTTSMLGGVCAGLADHLGLDPTLVRVLTVLVTVLGFGSVIIAYLVAWVIVPKDVDVYDVSPAPAPQPQHG